MITSDLTVPRKLAMIGPAAPALMFLVGCGSSSPSSSAKAAATASTIENTASQPATTTTTPPTNTAADQRIGQDAALKLSDVPSGHDTPD